MCLLGGCERRTASGQTLALVNGEPVTMSDLALERRLAPGSAEGVRQALIDRKLLAEDAEARGDGRGIDIVRLERRYHEVLLAQRTIDLVHARAPRPTPQEVRDYLTQHPELGAGRVILTVDRLRWSSPADEIGAPASLAALAATLGGRGITATAERVTIDSAVVPEAAWLAADRLRPGRVSISHAGPMVVAEALVGRRDAPLDTQAAERVVTRRLKTITAEQSLSRHLAALRAGARIVMAGN